MTDSEKWLVSFDTDRIKEYLFATSRLSEIRGASALLRQLDAARRAWIHEVDPGAEIIFSAGGGAAVLVSDEERAERLIALVSERVRRETLTASITGVALPPEQSNQPFGARMARAAERLREAKAAKAELAALPVEPYMRLCVSCGQHPATSRARDASGHYLCPSCFKKREHSGRAELFEWFRQHVEQETGEPGVWAETSLPEDLNRIGEVSTPPNYVGFIALDGNHIGDLLSEPKGSQQYRDFSEALRRMTETQTFAALQRYGRPRANESRRVSPFEIVLVGGDDVLLITAADIAVDVALAIVEGYEKRSRRDVLTPAGLAGVRDKLTMAGGVVLAHADFPVAVMQSLAEDLLKSAKRHCASHEYREGALDFVVISGNDTDLDDLRRTLPHRRPYSLGEMQSLLAYLHRFKRAGFPMSQLQAMYQALFTTKVNAQLVSVAAMGRLGQRIDRSQYDLLREFFQAFGVPFDGRLPPWDAGRPGRDASALTDLVDLYPFIVGRESHHGESAA